MKIFNNLSSKFKSFANKKKDNGFLSGKSEIDEEFATPAILKAKKQYKKVKKMSYYALGSIAYGAILAVAIPSAPVRVIGGGVAVGSAVAFLKYKKFLKLMTDANKNFSSVEYFANKKEIDETIKNSVFFKSVRSKTDRLGEMSIEDQLKQDKVEHKEDCPKTTEEKTSEKETEKETIVDKPAEKDAAIKENENKATIENEKQEEQEVEKQEENKEEQEVEI